MDLLKSPWRTTEHPLIKGVPLHIYVHCSAKGAMLGILEYEYEPKVVVNRFFETRDDGLVHVIYWEFATSGNYLWSKFFWKDESWKSFGFWWPWEPFSCADKIHVWSATIQHSWWKKSCTILDVKNLVNSGIKLPINWCNISSINSIVLIRLISPYSPCIRKTSCYRTIAFLIQREYCNINGPHMFALFSLVGVEDLSA